MSAIFSSILTDEFTISTYLICVAAALLCGVITAAVCAFRSCSSKSLILSLILLPPIVTTVITMVNGNIGTGVAVMGAFSLVRFRSVAGKARDIAAIFLAMTAGLACATGYIYLAAIFTLIICAVIFISSFMHFGDDKTMDLNITVPESINFYGAFDDIFKAYTKKYKLVKTKTTNMGSLYKLSYKIDIKDISKIQEFIDKLRTRNGNLEISICESLEGSEAL